MDSQCRATDNSRSARDPGTCDLRQFASMTSSVPSSRTRPSLSVILPNYNHGQLIAGAMSALAAQDRPADEIIIIDDGSTDDSLETIQALAAGSAVIRVLVNERNRGLTAALAQGLEASRGTHVYFGASDDWVLPGFFSTALSLFARYPGAGLVCGDTRLVMGSTGETLGLRPFVQPSRRAAYFPPDAVARLLRSCDNWIVTGSTVFERDCVVAAGGFAPDLGSFADGYLSRKVALTRGFCYIPRPMAVWRLSDDSISRQTASDPVQARTILANALGRFARDPAFPR